MEPPSSRSISVVNESGRRLRTASVRRAVAAAFAQKCLAGVSACVLLTDDETVRRLNREYRGVDEATDVLSFPSGEETELGDIAISVPYADRQAEARGVPLEQEIAYLAIHGALHLAGLEDEADEDRREMVATMNRAAVAAGLEPDEDWASLLHKEDA